MYILLLKYISVEQVVRNNPIHQITLFLIYSNQYSCLTIQVFILFYKAYKKENKGRISYEIIIIFDII